MRKSFIFIFLLLFSTAAFSMECASNFDQLKEVVGNPGLASIWKENGNDPLTLTIKNARSGLLLNFKKEGQEWANVIGVICRKGDKFVAKVDSIEWGSSSPQLARKRQLKEIIFKMPYDTMLTVSVSFFSFEFRAL